MQIGSIHCWMIASVFGVVPLVGCSGSNDSVPKDGAIVFTGGFETDPRDNGRPVNLIAAALDVETEVFRDAFSGVTPAKGGAPSHSEAQANKKVLMDALAKHGVTNERLDEVSDYYRYRPQAEEVWNHKPASAIATIEKGEVVAIKIIDPGAGYLTSPTASVKGHENVKLTVELDFNTDLKQNGRIQSITVVK